MSRILSELIGAFQDEVDKRSRGNDQVWLAVYDDLAGRRGDWNTDEADRTFNSLKAIFNFYYNDKYRNEDENTVFNYALDDALAFTWAKTLERHQEIGASQRDLADMDKILNNLAQLEDEMSGGRGRPTQQANRYSQGRYSNRIDERQNGYSKPAYSGAYNRNYGREQTTQRSGWSRGGNYDNGEGRSSFSNRSNEGENRPTETQSNYRTNAYTQNNASDARRATVVESEEVSPSSKDFDLDAFVTSSKRYHPDVKKHPDGRWIVTTWEATKNFTLHRDMPWRLFADPWTERLQLVIGEDGFIHQEVLEIKNMDIEDHKWVIQPKQHRFAKSPPPELQRPLVIRDVDEIELDKSSEVLRLSREIIEEYVKAGKLKSNARTLADVEDENTRIEIMKEANLRLIKFIEAQSNAKAVDQVEDVPATGRQNSFFKMMEEGENQTQEKVEMNRHSESLPIRSFKDAVNHVVTAQVNDGLQEGDIVPYERVDVLYRTENIAEYERIKELSGALKTRSKNLIEAFRLLTTDDLLPKDLVLAIDHKATQAVNRGLANILGKSWTVSSFVEDYYELSGLLKEEVKQERLTESQFNLFYGFVETEVCSIAFPTLESLKQHFRMDEEILAGQSTRCVYEYDFGTFVYMPFSASDLGLLTKGTTVIPSGKRTKLANVLEATDPQFKLVLGTKDGLFYQSVFDKQTDSFLVFPLVD